MKAQLFNTICSLPWQEIFNWVTGIGIPALLALWRKESLRHAESKAMLKTMVTGVEKSTDELGVDGRIVKRAIRNEAIQSGIDVSLDNFVQKVIETKDQSK